MLQRSLSEHAAGCFYSDEKLAESLYQTLLAPPEDIAAEGWQTVQEECYHLLVKSVDTRHPREHRLTDIRRLMGNICDGDLLLTPELPWLDELSSDLLQRNGDLLCYRETRVQAYVRLAAELDPTLLVAWHLSKWLQQSQLFARHDIRRVVTAQTAFFAPPGNPSLPYAEGHVHFWGITAESAILDKYLFTEHKLPVPKSKGDPWQSEQYETLMPLLKRARTLLILLLDRMISNPAEQIKRSKIQAENQDKDRLYKDWSDKLQQLHNPMLVRQHLPDWTILAAMHAAANIGSSDWLLGEFAQAMSCGGDNRWLWLHLYLCSRYQTSDTDPLERAAILCWWQTVNALRRSLIMDGQGLTRFTDCYYSTQLGRGGDQSRSENIRSLFASPGDVAEIKGTPSAFTSEFVKWFPSALASHAGQPLPQAPHIFGEDEIKLDAKALAYIQALERWQFCGHFLRSGKQKKYDKRKKADSKQLWKTAENLLKSLNQQSSWDPAKFLGAYQNPHFHFQPARWFRGLDVAGDENGLKIEWFAPMLRWLRSGFLARPDGERASTGFHLSIHAGEDYAHPASGMRHIDETVRFCEMRDGDRLGHALALGIEPACWAKRQGEMLLPLDEHLDNLVWLWHYATALSGRLTLAQQVLPLLERRITRFYNACAWGQIPTFSDKSDAEWADRPDAPADSQITATPDVLYRAWLLRGNCHYRLQQLLGAQPLTAQEKIALPDWESLADAADSAGRLFLNRHSHLATDNEPPLVIVRLGSEWQAQDSIGRQHALPTRNRQTSMPRAELLEDVETPAELEFMHALQDYLLDQYDNLGLIIEANPTSNVYIARLKNHSEHPIFRWHPPDETVLLPGAAENRHGLRRGPVRVLINTDDPGIMPTTLRTEFLLLREAAHERGVGRTLAERWLETLRRYGIEQFHRNHLPVFEPV